MPEYRTIAVSRHGAIIESVKFECVDDAETKVRVQKLARYDDVELRQGEHRIATISGAQKSSGKLRWACHAMRRSRMPQPGKICRRVTLVADDAGATSGEAVQRTNAAAAMTRAKSSGNEGVVAAMAFTAGRQLRRCPLRCPAGTLIAKIGGHGPENRGDLTGIKLVGVATATAPSRFHHQNRG